MNDDDTFKPMDSDLPARVADAFVIHMAAEGIQLRFDEASLIQAFNGVLDNHSERFKRDFLDVDGTSFDLPTAAGCYFGETLRRRYAGRWLGRLEHNVALNFYSVKLQFGNYRFSPFMWLNYRLSNGSESEGSVESCLAAVTPSMRDGIDYKRQKHDKIIESGGIAIDTDNYS